jgi:hypothetical protein
LPEEEEGIEAELNDDHANARGRDGDHLMGVPFECDLCHFRNEKRPNINSPRRRVHSPVYSKDQFGCMRQSGSTNS